MGQPLRLYQWQTACRCARDCAVDAARAVAHGGILIKEKTSIGEHGFIALVQDTEGNMIGFHSMVCKPSE